MIMSILISIIIACITFAIITFLIMVTIAEGYMWFYTIPASIIMLCLVTAGFIDICG
jgi:uncharacterized membrane protein